MGIFPEVHVRDAVTEHTHTVVFLHGRGGSGPDFADELSDLFEQFPGIKWVFPSAQERWSSVFKENMSEWFDTPSLSNISLNEHLQVEGLKTAVEYLEGVVNDEVKLLGSHSKVILGGMSQGEATALQVLLCGRCKVGGFVGVSGWLPFAGKVEEILADDSSSVSEFLREKLDLRRDDFVPVDIEGLPVFLGHGSDDEWVDVQLGKQVRDVLIKMKLQVEWKEYVGAEQDGHWLEEPEELDDIAVFLKEKLLCN